MELVIASNNKNKIREIREILDNFFEIVYSLDDLKISTEISEDGKTFFDNALIKAKAISKLTNMVVLADDSGLCVEALNNQPGVYSARYSGEHNDEKNMELLLENMKGIKNRNACFVSSIVLYYPNDSYVTTEGYTYGRILEQKEGTKGFGYDPIFFSNDLNMSFGIADSKDKNAVSHRGRALRELEYKLEKDNYYLI